MENRTVEMPLSVFSDLRKVIEEITATQKIGGVVPRPILKKLKGLLLQIIEEQKKLEKRQKELKEGQRELKEEQKELKERQEATALVVKQYMNDGARKDRKKGSSVQN